MWKSFVFWTLHKDVECYSRIDTRYSVVVNLVLIVKWCCRLCFLIFLIFYCSSNIYHTGLQLYDPNCWRRAWKSHWNTKSSRSTALCFLVEQVNKLCSNFMLYVNGKLESSCEDFYSGAWFDTYNTLLLTG